MKFKAAAVQTGPVEGDPEKTLQRSLDLLERAAAQDVKLAVFPELCYPGYNPLLAAKARRDGYEEGMTVLNSLAEPVPGGRPSAALPKGRESTACTWSSA